MDHALCARHDQQQSEPNRVAILMLSTTRREGPQDAARRWHSAHDEGVNGQEQHLDDLAAGRLEVGDLLAQGEGQLVGLGRAGDVLAREGPVQDGNRACEHAANTRQPSSLRSLQLVAVLNPAGR